MDEKLPSGLPTPRWPMSLEMPSWLEMLLTIEVVVLVTVVALAAPIAVVMLMHSVYKTLKRNR